MDFPLLANCSFETQFTGPGKGSLAGFLNRLVPGLLGSWRNLPVSCWDSFFLPCTIWTRLHQECLFVCPVPGRSPGVRPSSARVVIVSSWRVQLKSPSEEFILNPHNLWANFQSLLLFILVDGVCAAFQQIWKKKEKSYQQMEPNAHRIGTLTEVERF